jgi:flagellar basal body-associated protein FliL
MEVSTDSTTETLNMYNYLNNFFINPVVYIILLIILIAYFILFYSLGNKNKDNSSNSSGSEEKSGSGNIVTMIIIIVVIILLVINGLTYFFGINLVAYITGLFNGQPTVNIIVDEQNITPTSPPVPEIPFIEEVFNIPGNYYSYNDSKALCNAYGAKLATYEQIEKSYDKGAEWCNYGWSDGQMALFPTQKNTFNELQKVDGHQHDCGRPGINGGYIANPDVKFGVNCFGHKPVITKVEKEIMDNTTLYPKTKEDTEFQKKVDYWKEHVDEILVSPFNSTTWSRI